MEDRQQSNNRRSFGGTTWARLLFCGLAATAILPTTTASWADTWSSGGHEPSLQQHPSLVGTGTSPVRKDLEREDEFTLRHVLVHGLYKNPNLHVRRDIDPNDDIRISGDEESENAYRGPFHVKSQKTMVQRLSDRRLNRMRSLYRRAKETGSPATLQASEWTLDTISGPNVTDQDTVINLAKISWCAYTEVPGTSDWPNVGPGFNETQGFGWKGDNLRGHIFANKDNSTIIVSIKGTSPAFWDGAETTTNDKINDNLFFGCCCGEGGHFLWRAACSCKTSTFTCNRTCVVDALKSESRYYSASLELYGNVTELYPQSEIWLVGHSLGGATSALLGLTFGLPVVTFESPGDALAASRLSLPPPPDSHPQTPQDRKYTGAVHFGHTADPIFMGTCNAATSACTLGGYALQTQCHTGTVCRYDTVADFGWSVSISYHKIRYVIDDVLEVYDRPPPCFPDEECVDCFNWKYFDSNGSENSTTSSSSSSSTSSTRTTTCKTPGWWGCLDETTTTTSSTTSSPTGPITSCVEYGWFGGCLETTTINPTPTHIVNTTVTATTCVQEGWFGGCLETSTTTFTTTTAAENTAGLWTTSCAEYGWFWGCARMTTIPITKTRDALTSCLEYDWWGWGACLASTTLYPEQGVPTPAPAMVPTVTTTRPLSEVQTGQRIPPTASMTPYEWPDL